MFRPSAPVQTLRARPSQRRRDHGQFRRSAPRWVLRQRGPCSIGVTADPSRPPSRLRSHTPAFNAAHRSRTGSSGHGFCTRHYRACGVIWDRLSATMWVEPPISDASRMLDPPRRRRIDRVACLVAPACAVRRDVSARVWESLRVVARLLGERAPPIADGRRP